jgi:hypothetical protein
MPKPILDYRDDDSPLWPARCRGYLEGRQASDCLASVELARLRAEKEALLAENNDLRREWLHTVSHDVVFTAEVNGEHGIDLSKMPISEATLAALNIGIDRENYRLRAECERLRTALTATQWSTGHGLYSCCPQCHGLEPPGSKYPSLDGSAGHSPDCPIAAALKDEP